MVGLDLSRWGSLSTQAERLSARIMGKSGNYGQKKNMEIKMRFILRRDLPDIKANAISTIQSLPSDKEWEVEIKAHQNTRSGAQNRTLFGLIYPQLMEFMGLSGERDKEELHEYFCGEYFGWHDKQIMGKIIHRPKRTTTTNEEGRKSTLDKLEFSQFVDWIIQRASEYGCVIEMPSELAN